MINTYRWLYRLFWLYVIYLALVVLILMPLGNALLPGVVKDQTGRTLHFDLLAINPFTLEVSLHAASLFDEDGVEFVHADRILINASLLQSLALRHPVLDAFELRQLRARVRRDAASGQFNFNDILEHRQALETEESPEDSSADSATLPALTIRRLAFSAEELSYQEYRPGTDPFTNSVRDFALVLKDFSTVQEEGQPYRLAATAAEGGALYWEGDISIAAGRSQGRLQLKAIDLLPVHEYFADQLGLVASSALLDADVHYQVDWGSETLQLMLQDSEVILRELMLAARNDPDTQVQLDRLSIAGIALNLREQALGIADLTIHGLAISGHSDEAAISLQPMFSMELATQDDTAEESDTPWRLTLDQLHLDDSRIAWQAAELEEPLEIVPRISLTALHWPAMDSPAALDAHLTINDSTTWTASGDLQPDGSSLHLQGSLEQLPLHWINPALGNILRARLRDGLLSSRWELLHEAHGIQQLMLAEGGIGPLSLTPADAGPTEVLVAWDAISWQDVLLDLARQQLTLNTLALQQPRGRLAIAADGRTNIHDLIQDPPSAAAPAEVESDTEATSSWDVAVQTVTIHNGELDFSDASLALPFRVQVQQFSGTIEKLDSRAGVPAQVDLSGRVDGYAPVALLGTIQPLASPPELDLDFNFQNLDLPTLTPYSGTYAGYSLRHGQLSVTLRYTLEQGRIQGDNRVIIDQLQLGEAVESPRAIDLPLRLAIALLKDANGVIDLGVQVKGDIDDPEFDLGGVIWMAFRNLIVKAVTAPFHLLASLVHTDQALDHVGFEPGSSTADRDAAAVLDNLAEALQRRPALRLSLAGQVSEEDSNALAAQNLDAALIAQGLRPESVIARDRAWEHALMKHYQKTFPEGTDRELSTEDMEQALLPSYKPSSEQLGNLAQTRALWVKQALVVDRSLSPERVFIERPDTVMGSRSGVELGLAP